MHPDTYRKTQKFPLKHNARISRTRRDFLSIRTFSHQSRWALNRSLHGHARCLAAAQLAQRFVFGHHLLRVQLIMLHCMPRRKTLHSLSAVCGVLHLNWRLNTSESCFRLTKHMFIKDAKTVHGIGEQYIASPFREPRRHVLLIVVATLAEQCVSSGWLDRAVVVAADRSLPGSLLAHAWACLASPEGFALEDHPSGHNNKSNTA